MCSKRQENKYLSNMNLNWLKADLSLNHVEYFSEMFVCGFTYQSITFHLYGDVIISIKWLQILSCIGTHSRGAVTTRFEDLCMSRLGFKHSNFRIRTLNMTVPPSRFFWAETFINVAAVLTYTVLVVSQICSQWLKWLRNNEKMKI